MPQANELEFQGGAATKPEGEDGNDGRQNRDHACDGTAVAPKSLDFSEFEVLSKHRIHLLSYARSDDPDAGIGQLGLEIALQLHFYTPKR